MQFRNRLFLLFFSILMPLTLWGTDSSLDFARDLVRYLGIDKVSDQDLASLAELKQKAEAADLTEDQRKAALQNLFQHVARLQRPEPLPQGSLDRLVQYAMMWHCPGDSAPIFASNAKRGELARVTKHGTGAIRMILIPDVGFDGSVFQTFVERNGDRFTLYAVTIPGFGGLPALPRFDHRDYSQLRLWKNAEQAVLSLIEKEKMNRPVIMGHQGGAYLALRIALDYPDRVRSAIVLNGLLYAPIPTPKDPSGRLTITERQQMAKTFLPIELFPRPSRDCVLKAWLNPPGMLSKDPERNEWLAKIAANSDAHLVWDHYAELRTTDLTDEIPNLKVPVAVIPSIDGADQQPPSLTQWQTVHSPLLKVVPIENSGAFATEDNPQALDRIIQEFVK